MVRFIPSLVSNKSISKLFCLTLVFVCVFILSQSVFAAYSPSLNSFTCPSEVYVGDVVAITFTATNDGSTTAPIGNISVSLQNADSFGVNNYSDGADVERYAVGDSINNKSGNSITAKYPLVELTKTDWSEDEEAFVRVNATPKSTANYLYFYVRATFSDSGWSNIVNYPSSGSTDQQGYVIKECKIPVKTKSSSHPPSDDPVDPCNNNSCSGNDGSGNSSDDSLNEFNGSSAISFATPLSDSVVRGKSFFVHYGIINANNEKTDFSVSASLWYNYGLPSSAGQLIDLVSSENSFLKSNPEIDSVEAKTESYFDKEFRVPSNFYTRDDFYLRLDLYEIKNGIKTLVGWFNFPSDLITVTSYFDSSQCVTYDVQSLINQGLIEKINLSGSNLAPALDSSVKSAPAFAIGDPSITDFYKLKKPAGMAFSDSSNPFTINKPDFGHVRCDRYFPLKGYTGPHYNIHITDNVSGAELYNLHLFLAPDPSTGVNYLYIAEDKLGCFSDKELTKLFSKTKNEIDGKGKMSKSATKRIFKKIDDNMDPVKKNSAVVGIVVGGIVGAGVIALEIATFPEGPLATLLAAGGIAFIPTVAARDDSLLTPSCSTAQIVPVNETEVSPITRVSRNNISLASSQYNNLDFEFVQNNGNYSGLPEQVNVDIGRDGSKELVIENSFSGKIIDGSINFANTFNSLNGSAFAFAPKLLTDTGPSANYPRYNPVDFYLNKYNLVNDAILNFSSNINAVEVKLNEQQIYSRGAFATYFVGPTLGIYNGKKQGYSRGYIKELGSTVWFQQEYTEINVHFPESFPDTDYDLDVSVGNQAYDLEITDKRVDGFKARAWVYRISPVSRFFSNVFESSKRYPMNYPLQPNQVSFDWSAKLNNLVFPSSLYSQVNNSINITDALQQALDSCSDESCKVSINVKLFGNGQFKLDSLQLKTIPSTAKIKSAVSSYISRNCFNMSSCNVPVEIGLDKGTTNLLVYQITNNVGSQAASSLIPRTLIQTISSDVSSITTLSNSSNAPEFAESNTTIENANGDFIKNQIVNNSLASESIVENNSVNSSEIASEAQVLEQKIVDEAKVNSENSAQKQQVYSRWLEKLKKR